MEPARRADRGGRSTLAGAELDASRSALEFLGAVDLFLRHDVGVRLDRRIDGKSDGIRP